MGAAIAGVVVSAARWGFCFDVGCGMERRREVLRRCSVALDDTRRDMSCKSLEERRWGKEWLLGPVWSGAKHASRVLEFGESDYVDRPLPGEPCHPAGHHSPGKSICA